MKKVLLFGAGRIAGPYIDYLTRKGDCELIAADISPDSLARVAGLSERITVERMDAYNNVEAIIDRYAPDVVSIFLPPECLRETVHICMEKNVNVVHPIYLSDELRAMREEIEARRLIVIAELGLDPGIDHMAAARTIDKIHACGGAVESFRSLCGALPAPDSNMNPWGYKLSWSPATLIAASKRTAKIIENGEEIVWPNGETYEHPFLYDIDGLGTFEAYANADAAVYAAVYNIPEAKSIYRGTLRYPGWCETISYMNRIGYFETSQKETKGLTFADFTSRQCGFPGKEAKEAMMRRFNLNPWSAFIMRMEWLGFFEDKALPFDAGSPRDVVSHLFAEKLNFTEKERDIVILYDTVRARYPDGRRKEYKSVLIDYGVPGKWTSCARTTGVPPAVAVRFILEGKISTPGLYTPTSREIYEPVLNELEDEGIILDEYESDL
ncbi:saccharopine dehydrogenase C-terminal domain-containing protein [Synergistes jonesii]|uniref:saccharopine dehydrogenase C-terminal domain-containing protein n=1 Tax=Synergistes jonesii TaxID=2754 RepID=UPI00242F92B3|nr:saccharopine dehydrogenase C-terminal domain-containing protein [Synergistes jonesii]